MDPTPPSPPSLLPPEARQPVARMRVAFALLFVTAVGLALYVVWPFRAPLILAAVLASVLQRPFRVLQRLARGRRAVAGAATTLTLVVLLIGPLAAIIAFATTQIVRGLAFVRDELGIENVAQLRHGQLSPRAQELLDQLLGALHVSRAQLGDFAHQASTVAEGGVSRIVASSGRATFHTAIMLIAFYFFLVEGARIVDWMRRVSPLEARQTRDLIDEFRAVSRATILGTAIAAFFQALLATLGYFITGVPHAVFFGLCTLVASFIPVVGTLLVWLPAAAFLWLAGSHGSAILLGVWCLVFVVGAEHIGKPLALRYVLGGQQEMHTGIVFLSLLGGLEMFGLIGLILGPLVFAFLLAMLRIYERDFRRADPSPPSAAA
ncbi:MAG TPA: AI-2E family transporter [Polyangia bacterium]|jgi:predicted PurR-regulated permease PerM